MKSYIVCVEYTLKAFEDLELETDHEPGTPEFEKEVEALVREFKKSDDNIDDILDTTVEDVE